jgi:DNA-binding NtrC family response regulator
MEKLRILILDDEKGYRDCLEEAMKSSGYDTYTASSPGVGLNICEDQPIDIMLLDLHLPDMGGLEVLQRAKKINPDTEIIIITGHGDMGIVIDAMRMGAADFFTKPFRILDVENAILRTKRYADLLYRLNEAERNNHLLKNELKGTTGCRLIGDSPAIRNIMEMMGKVAKTDDTSVLIFGESGTGKELVARGIHCLSKRKEQYFQAVNCAAIPDTLFESEFFGHQKGSFTGATENQTGYFELAAKGTLFLDEISTLPFSQQSKFLRVLDQKTITRLGSHKDIQVDTRIIAATNQDLNELCNEKKFRVDLYHRLNTINIFIPPLRERTEDIPVLTHHFIDLFSKSLGRKIYKIEDQAMAKLIRYHFPGNVRELKNLIERAIILNEGGVIHAKDFVIHTDIPIQHNVYPLAYSILDLNQVESLTIKMAMEKAKNNKSLASKYLNISRQSLIRKLSKTN